MKHGFRQVLAGGKLLTGTIVTLEAPAVAERLAEAGFDWLFLDGEHAPLDSARMQVILQAVGGRCPCLIRVPSIDEVWIKQTLDIGADGVIVPQIRSADEAARVVAWCRYPPDGARSVGVGRAQGYGARFHEYLNHANDDIAVILQIEHVDAVANVDKIAAVPGIDALFIGPYDLSSSLGTPGDVSSPKVTDAVRQVADACRESGLAAGIFGMRADDVRPWIDNGFRLIAVGIDVVFMGAAADAALGSLRRN
jgi:2-dehydro-3-deoxyglucarate aldolase